MGDTLANPARSVSGGRVFTIATHRSASIMSLSMGTPIDRNVVKTLRVTLSPKPLYLSLE